MDSISTPSSFHNTKYAECIEAYYNCANSCEYCGTLCLHEVSNKMLLECLELCSYCADVCRFASKHMSRDSIRVEEFCDYCAKVCEDCSNECEKHEMDHCKQCAKVCRVFKNLQ